MDSASNVWHLWREWLAWPASSLWDIMREINLNEQSDCIHLSHVVGKHAPTLSIRSATTIIEAVASGVQCNAASRLFRMT